MKKKILCLLLTLCFCGSVNTAYAQETTLPYGQPDPSSTETATITLTNGEAAEIVTLIFPDGTIEVADPRLTGLRRLTSGAANSGNTMSCTATVRPYSGYNVEVQLVAQQSTDKSSWSDLKRWNASVTTTSSDTVITKNTTISSGYYYRLMVRASVYENSTDKFVESVSAASSPFYY